MREGEAYRAQSTCGAARRTCLDGAAGRLPREDLAECRIQPEDTGKALAGGNVQAAWAARPSAKRKKSERGPTEVRASRWGGVLRYNDFFFNKKIKKKRHKKNVYMSKARKYYRKN